MAAAPGIRYRKRHPPAAIRSTGLLNSVSHPGLFNYGCICWLRAPAQFLAIFTLSVGALRSNTPFRVGRHAQPVTLSANSAVPSLGPGATPCKCHLEELTLALRLLQGATKALYELLHSYCTAIARLLSGSSPALPKASPSLTPAGGGALTAAGGRKKSQKVVAKTGRFGIGSSDCTLQLMIWQQRSTAQYKSRFLTN
jgi:hypothetical protein